MTSIELDPALAGRTPRRTFSRQAMITGFLILMAVLIAMDVLRRRRRKT